MRVNEQPEDLDFEDSDEGFRYAFPAEDLDFEDADEGSSW